MVIYKSNIMRVSSLLLACLLLAVQTDARSVSQTYTKYRLNIAVTTSGVCDAVAVAGLAEKLAQAAVMDVEAYSGVKPGSTAVTANAACKAVVTPWNNTLKWAGYRFSLTFEAENVTVRDALFSGVKRGGCRGKPSATIWPNLILTPKPDRRIKANNATRKVALLGVEDAVPCAPRPKASPSPVPPVEASPSPEPAVSPSPAPPLIGGPASSPSPGDDILSMPNPCSYQWPDGSSRQYVNGLYTVPSRGCLQYVACKQGAPNGPVLSCAPGQLFSLGKQTCVPATTEYCMSDTVAASPGATAYINQTTTTPSIGKRKLMQAAQNATPAYLVPDNWHMVSKYELFDLNRVSKWLTIGPDFPVSRVQYYKLTYGCYPQELCIGSPKYSINARGTMLVTATTIFYECEQEKLWDGQRSCSPGSSSFTGIDTSSYVNVSGLVSSGSIQKALPCSSIDVVRNALIANPQATFALRDSNSAASVRPVFFTVKNAAAVVAGTDVQEVVMEYFDTKVFEFTNVTVTNSTDSSQITYKVIDKQTKLTQRPNGVSTLVRLSADGMCWFGIVTNSSSSSNGRRLLQGDGTPSTPGEAARALAAEAVANSTDSANATALEKGSEPDFTHVFEFGAAAAGFIASVNIVLLCVVGAEATFLGAAGGSIAIAAGIALVGVESVAAVTAVAFAVAAGAIILAAAVVIFAVIGIIYLLHGGCFPAAATAYLALSGAAGGGIGTKRMDQLMLGDNLVTMHASNGSATTSPVYLMGHKDANTYASFVQLQLQSGQVVQLTREHFLPTFAGVGAYATATYELPAVSNVTADSCSSSGDDSCSMLSQIGVAYEGMPCVPSGYAAAAAAAAGTNAQPSSPAAPIMIMKRASEVVVGSDLLCAFDNSTGGFALSRVVSKESVLLQGLYAPFTMSGDLVVNGVLVSSHSDWYLDRVMPGSLVHHLPAIYQASMAPARLAYRLGGAPLINFLDDKLNIVQLASAVSL